MDLTFLVDTSGSIRQMNPSNGSWIYWNLMKDFMKSVVGGFPRDSLRVAVVEFGRTGRVNTPLTDPDTAERVIDGMQYPGDVSSLSNGLQTVITSILSDRTNRNNAFDVVMVLTDSVRNLNPADVVPFTSAIRVTGPTGAKLVTAVIAGSAATNRAAFVQLGLADKPEELQLIQNPFSVQNDASSAVQTICRYLVQCTTPNGCPSIVPPPGKMGKR